MAEEFLGLVGVVVQSHIGSPFIEVPGIESQGLPAPLSCHTHYSTTVGHQLRSQQVPAGRTRSRCCRSPHPTG